MQVKELIVDQPQKEGVTLEYMRLTREFAEIRDYCLHKGETVTGYTGNGEAVSVRVEDVLYFEAVGELVFAYAENAVYEVKKRLYQIEEGVRRNSVQRASKSTLINTEHIVSVRPALNGRLFAKMENGEEVLISRNYAKQIAKCIMEGDDEEI